MKTLVINTVRTLKISSVSEILDRINFLTNKNYAYTTIATIIKRLEDENVIRGRKMKKEGRKKTYYSVNLNAHEDEVQNFLQLYIKKFGKIGIKHLADLMGTDLDENEIKELRSKIYLEEE